MGTFLIATEVNFFHANLLTEISFHWHISFRTFMLSQFRFPVTVLQTSGMGALLPAVMLQGDEGQGQDR